MHADACHLAGDGPCNIKTLTLPMKGDLRMGILEGQVALISGVARGQGRSHAVEFARQGADVIGFDICAPVESAEYDMATKDDLDETVRLVEQHGRRMAAQVIDVRDHRAVGDFVDAAVAGFGRLDIVVANAGVFTGLGEKRHSREAFTDAVDIMLTGVFNTVTSARPHLEANGGGSIVITSSTGGLKGLGDATPGCLGYNAAKHAVVGLMREWAVVLGPKSIRVNTIHPGGVSTRMVLNPAMESFVAEVPEFASSVNGFLLPVNLMDAADVTSAVLFLCSDAGRYVTGVALPVDAGLTSR